MHFAIFNISFNILLLHVAALQRMFASVLKHAALLLRALAAACCARCMQRAQQAAALRNASLLLLEQS